VTIRTICANIIVEKFDSISAINQEAGIRSDHGSHITALYSAGLTKRNHIEDSIAIKQYV
jgi:hypothetical protein